MVEMRDEPESRPLGMPSDTSLPVFVYGFLKPTELAYSIIHNFVESAKPDRVYGTLWVRDALPLLDPDRVSMTAGFLIFPNDATSLYELICRFEPRKHYKWSTTETLDHEVLANVLQGIRPRLAGAEKLDDADFKSCDDVVLHHGLEAVRIALRDASTRYGEANYFFQIQMAYMLLWSVVERYASLKHGPWLEPSAKLKKLAGDNDWVSAVAQLSPIENTVVFDSRQPTKPVAFDTTRPDKALSYFYRIRSNISHRGKGAIRDADMVRSAARSLLLCIQFVWRKNKLLWTEDDRLAGAHR